ncbi:uncharacterized protein P174DRAFT_468447 [Aspergillus novofumigatus IBT 16806]|uniref:Uncharacterized protein n=1 Tax=Aspergillus novofumigatus (strain IBT 16806) TaxID=1392255 RepID=A0A2I1CN93_ASPN1|nr:uncharacterized protein P174DRAFT_468447 [Aspergillus novofumigatus IBT 16806]PKX99072.1 hypothetical protein P174DRAFT_468447 [Aspergillus novofumigatus IBT 16806]
MMSPISCLARCPSSPLHPLYNPHVSHLSRLGLLESGHLTQACIKLRPHVPAPGALHRLLANSTITQVSHEGYNDYVSLGAKPSFIFNETGYIDDERLFFEIEANLASVERFNDAETMEICEFFG